MNKFTPYWILLRVVLPLAFTARLLFTFLFTDLNSTNYWEYGEIALNLLEGKGYSLFYLLNGKIDIYHQQLVAPYPSAYVPPGYTLFITLFSLIENIWLRNLLIHIVQHAVSLAVILLLYRITAKLFNEKAALAAALLFAFTPEFMYASASYGPTVFYQALVLYISWLVMRAETGYRQYALVGILFACALYLRSEITVWMGLLLLLWTGRGKLKQALVVALIAEALLLPWQIRNYQTFHRLIPFTSSDGINLYRGHNPHGIGEWGWAEHVYTQTDYLCSDPLFETRFSQMYRSLAMDYIRTHPQQELKNVFKKIFHLWVLNAYDERAMHPLYIIPWLLTLSLGLWGLFRSFNFGQQYVLLLFLTACTLTAILFFALPRYQTIMKTALLPFAGYTLATLVSRLKKKQI